MELASRATSLFNGALVGGFYLSVALARFPRQRSGGQIDDDAVQQSSPGLSRRAVEVCRSVGLSVDEEMIIVGEGLEGAEGLATTERRRRGRPRKNCDTRKRKGLGSLVEEVAEVLVVEVSPDRSLSLILPEARGSDRALTRARRDFLIAKQVGAVPIGSEEETIQSLADHLLATHPRLYSDL